MMSSDDIVNDLLGPDGEPESPENQQAYDFAKEFWLKFPYGSSEFASEVIRRFSDHLEWFDNANIGNAIWAAYRAYHSLEGPMYRGSKDPIVSIMEAGEDGEFLSLRMNNYRGLVKHQIALVTANRPAWEPQATTTDSDATKQVTLARNLMDYLMDAKGIGQKVKTQYETAKVTACGFLALGWKEAAGLKEQGSAWALPLAPWEVAHEKVRVYDDCTWWIFRAYESRWDWVARFAESDPDKARQIAGMSSAPKVGNAFMHEDPNAVGADTDRIEVLYLYAKPTPACPEGRVSVVADGDLVLLDGPNPYGDICPITRVCPAEFVGTSVPFGDSWVLLAPDEAYNAIMSMCLTRVDGFGVPNIAAPVGSDFKPSDFSGMQILEVTPGQSEPKVLDMLSIPNELPNLMGLLQKGMENLSGINSVTRGQPQENVSSGSFAALLQSMAIQFNSSDEEAWVRNLEQVGTYLLKIYQRMATDDQLIQICGSDQMWSVREFKGEDLARVSRVAVKTTNALQKTQAGKMSIAESMLERGLVKTPQEYIQALNTGNIEPLFSGPVNELAMIKQENEMLMRGDRSPIVSVWDNDQLHIDEHRCLVDSHMRYDETASQRVMEHLQAHLENWQTKTLQAPDILAAIGQPPAPGSQMAMQQAQGGPPQGGEPPRQAPQPGREDAPKRGPAPGPQGNEPPRMPAQPAPAKTPGGEPVV